MKRKLTMQKVQGALTALAVALSLAACGTSAGTTAGQQTSGGGTISVYNWGDYIDESLLAEFEAQTGITVIYDTFATNEDMYTKLKNGGASYDIAIPSDYMIEKMIKEDMLEEIDFNNIPNYKNIDARFTTMPYDPDSKYSVPYMWGTLGILYNTTMVDEPVDSWDILWNEKYNQQIFMYDSMRDAMTAPLKKMGYSLNSTDIAQLEEAKALLIEQKPLVQAYVGDLVKDKMIGGEGALAIVYSGDAVYCMEENPDLAYAVPKEGSNVWCDAIVIPKGAKNKAGAEAFINFLCEGEAALANTEYIGFSTVNQEAYKMLPEEQQQDPVYWPSDAVYENCEVFLDVGDALKEYDRIWTEILVSQ